MDPNLIIDDEYVYAVGSACARRGEALEAILDSYVQLLTQARSDALISGEIADALGVFIECVTMLNDQITTISDNINKITQAYVQEINTADSYLF